MPQRLDAYKLPVAVTFVDQIPRNPSSKILKQILRERCTEADVDSYIMAFARRRWPSARVVAVDNLFDQRRAAVDKPAVDLH
jgi:hypothetical protein